MSVPLFRHSMSGIHDDIVNISDKNLAHNISSRKIVPSRNESKIILFNLAGCSQSEWIILKYSLRLACSKTIIKHQFSNRTLKPSQVPTRPYPLLLFFVTLCRVFTIMYMKQTMSLVCIVLQVLYNYIFKLL
jgi:hypothetical protein